MKLKSNQRNRLCWTNMNKNKLEALKLVLDFVERWNKQDKEVEVAEAVGVLEEYIKQQDIRLTEQCFCKSYFDDDNQLQDCTCGKCKKNKSEYDTVMVHDEEDFDKTTIINI